MYVYTYICNESVNRDGLGELISALPSAPRLVETHIGICACMHIYRVTGIPANFAECGMRSASLLYCLLLLLLLLQMLRFWPHCYLICWVCRRQGGRGSSWSPGRLACANLYLINARKFIKPDAPRAGLRPSFFPSSLFCSSRAKSRARGLCFLGLFSGRRSLCWNIIDGHA